MIKYIAKQVAPECQESPFEYCDGSHIYRMILVENRNFHGIVGDGCENYEYIKKALDSGDLCDDLTSAGTDDGRYKDRQSCLQDYFPRKEPYTAEEIAEIEKIALLYCDRKNVDGYWGDEEKIARMLSIVEGGDWKTKTLYGYSDGIVCIYDSDVWSRDELDRIEAEYFNTGSEFMVYAADETEDDAFSVYCIALTSGGKKREIAAAACCDTDQVALWLFDGWKQTPLYKIA